MKLKAALFTAFSFLLFFPSSFVLATSIDRRSLEDDSEQHFYLIKIVRPADANISSKEDIARFYRSFLPDSFGGFARSRLLLYTDWIAGFCVSLTNKELEELKKKKGFQKAIPFDLLRD